MFYSIRKQYILEGEPGEEQVTPESHHDRSHQKQKAEDEDHDMLVAGGRGDVVAMES